MIIPRFVLFVVLPFLYFTGLIIKFPQSSERNTLDGNIIILFLIILFTIYTLLMTLNQKIDFNNYMQTHFTQSFIALICFNIFHFINDLYIKNTLRWQTKNKIFAHGYFGMLGIDITIMA